MNPPVRKEATAVRRWSFTAMNRKAFMLFEVMVSIVIITTMLLFIARSYSASKNAILRSKELIRTSLLLEAKLFELEAAGEISEGKNEGFFAKDSNLYWSIDAKLIKGYSLNCVTLEVFRGEDRAKPKYHLITYLKNKTS